MDPRIRLIISHFISQEPNKSYVAFTYMARFVFPWENNMIYHIVNKTNIRVYHANSEGRRNNRVCIFQEKDRSLYIVKFFTSFSIIIVGVNAWKVANTCELFKCQSNLVFLHFICENTMYVVKVSINHYHKSRKSFFKPSSTKS